MVEVDFETITFDLLEIQQVAVTYFHSVVEGFYVALSRQISAGERLIEDCNDGLELPLESIQQCLRRGFLSTVWRRNEKS